MVEQQSLHRSRLGGFQPQLERPGTAAEGAQRQWELAAPRQEGSISKLLHLCPLPLLPLERWLLGAAAAAAAAPPVAAAQPPFSCSSPLLLLRLLFFPLLLFWLGIVHDRCSR